MTDTKADSDAMSEMGRKGGLKGGKARAAKLTREERSEIARAAAEKRWEGHESKGPKLPKATHSGELEIGDLQLPVYNLSDGRRALSQGGMLQVLGMKRGSNPALGGDRLSNFISGKLISPFISEELASAIRNPFRFHIQAGGSIASGYQAETLVDLCSAIATAERAGKLQYQQKKVIAGRAFILMAAFSKVGVVALVDEATGYQYDRARDELQVILKAYISKGLLPWSKRFPPEFFNQLFRLYGWELRDDGKRPHPVAHFIKEYVYGRLPRGVLEELERRNPPVQNGRRRHKHHQFLTPDTGHEHLDRQIMTVSMFLTAAGDMNEFRRLLDRVQPLAGTPMDPRRLPST